MNWWAHLSEVRHALDIVPDCVVGLHEHAMTQGGLKDRLYSGIVMLWRNRPFWFSAGHVIQSIREDRDNPELKDVKLRLVDNVQLDNARAIPIDPHNRHLVDFQSEGVDVGFLPVDVLTLRSLATNSNFRPFVLDAWEAPSITARSGVFTTGYAAHNNQSVESSRTVRPVNSTTALVTETRVLNPGLSCLPLSRPVAVSRLRPTGLAFVPGTEVCRLLVGAAAFPDVEGLSGGPVWIASKGRRRFRHVHLWGLQTSWNKSTRCIRVLTLARVHLLLEDILETILNEEAGSN